MVDDAVDRQRLFGERVATSHFDGTVLDVTCADGQTDRHATHLVFGELEARSHVVGGVHFDADAEGLELVCNGVNLLEDGIQLLLLFEDRHDSHLDRSQMRRQDESVVVGVGHDECAHQSRRDAPGRSPYILGFVLFGEERHVERLGEILSQEMAGTGLQRLAVLHHGFDAVGVECARKTLVRRLDSLQYGDSHHRLDEVGIYVQHLLCEVLGLLFGSVGGVALLPEELGRTEEEAGSHLPSHHVAPLVAQDRQVAVGRDPVFVRTPDDGLRCRTDDQFLLQTCVGVHHHALTVGVVHQSVVRHYGALFGETFHMFGLTAQERFGDQQREIRVLHALGLETCVQTGLDALPDGVAVGFDHHAATYGRLFGQVRFYYQFVVPLRVVLASGCKFLISHVIDNWTIYDFTIYLQFYLAERIVLAQPLESFGLAFEFVAHGPDVPDMRCVRGRVGYLHVRQSEVFQQRTEHHL